MNAFARESGPSESNRESTAEENFASLPYPLCHAIPSPVSHTLDDDDMYSESLKVKKRVRSQKRTLHIHTTCSTRPMERTLVSERRQAIDIEMERIQRQSEVAPVCGRSGAVSIARSDIGREITFEDAHRLHRGQLESLNWRTVRPRDGNTHWKARIAAVRLHGSDVLRGVHEARIIRIQ